ncbi:MAG: hypothetical protein ACTSRP_21920 [Candidatus Helarchaeota archaeon]
MTLKQYNKLIESLLKELNLYEDECRVKNIKINQLKWSRTKCERFLKKLRLTDLEKIVFYYLICPELEDV